MNKYLLIRICEILKTCCKPEYQEEVDKLVAVLNIKAHTPEHIQGEKNMLADMVVELVCERFEISEIKIKGSSRERRYCLPRQLAMYVLKRKTELSLSRIADIFGRDHTTVIHAIKTIDDLLDSNEPGIANHIEYLEKILSIKAA